MTNYQIKYNHNLETHPCIPDHLIWKVVTVEFIGEKGWHFQLVVLGQLNIHKVKNSMIFISHNPKDQLQIDCGSKCE